MKNKKILLLLCVSFILVGCNRNSSSVSSIISNTTSENVTLSSNSSGNTSSISNSYLSESSVSTTSSNEINNTSSEEDLSSTSEEKILSDLEVIKECARGLKSSVNDLGVAESNVKVSLDLKILSVFDMITTKNGMGNRYKLLMSDGNGFIYVKTNADVYQKAKSRIGQTLNIQGTVSLYCDLEEITHDGTFTLGSKSIPDPEFKKVSLEEAYAYTDEITLNGKGCNGGTLVQVECKYLGKMDDTNGLFFDGEYIINVHGDSKFLNSLKIGSSYNLNGALNVFNFRPGLQYYSSSSSEKEFSSIDVSKLELMDDSAYSIKYEVDKLSKYPEYSNMFKKLRKIEGYVNYYVKDSKYYTVFDKEYKEDYYNAYTNAMNAKALFFKNESMVNLSSEIGLSKNPLHEHYVSGNKVSIVVAPYLWNTNKYWQVYALENSITIIDAQ